MTTVKENQKAPYFKAEDTNGNTVKLSDFKGKNLVLYFYPKDDTPGCTKEACSFRDNISKIKELGAEIIGVSPDDSKSHKKFTEKYILTFPLLCDTENKISTTYGAYGEKTKFGKTYMGIIRSTFIIDKERVIRKIFSNVKVDGHTEEVIKILETLNHLS